MFLQCFLLKFSMQHLSTQEPNLSHERSTQSTVALLSFPGFYRASLISLNVMPDFPQIGYFGHDPTGEIEMRIEKSFSQGF